MGCGCGAGCGCGVGCGCGAGCGAGFTVNAFATLYGVGAAAVVTGVYTNAYGPGVAVGEILIVNIRNRLGALTFETAMFPAGSNDTLPFDESVEFVVMSIVVP